MTKPVFKTRCRRFLDELVALQKKHDLNMTNIGVFDVYEDTEFFMLSELPHSNGDYQWFEIRGRLVNND